jgi:hypothetical protein
MDGSYAPRGPSAMVGHGVFVARGRRRSSVVWTGLDNVISSVVSSLCVGTPLPTYDDSGIQTAGGKSMLCPGSSSRDPLSMFEVSSSLGLFGSWDFSLKL